MKSFRWCLLVCFGLASALAWGQARPTGAQPTGSGTTGADSGKNDGRYLYEFGKVPTFADHDIEAARKEAELPIRFPVLPLFQVSLELPGYVDPLRRMSMITFDAHEEELDDRYSHPDQWAEDLAANEFHGAEYGGEKVPISIATVTSAAGKRWYLVKYRMEFEGEWWIQWQMVHAEADEGGGVRLIKVVAHWPSDFAEMCEKEMSYYLDQSAINPKKR